MRSNLKKFLEDDFGQEQFKQFLHSEFSVESILFWSAARNFRQGFKGDVYGVKVDPRQKKPKNKKRRRRGKKKEDDKDVSSTAGSTNLIYASTNYIYGSGNYYHGNVTETGLSDEGREGDSESRTDEVTLGEAYHK